MGDLHFEPFLLTSIVVGGGGGWWWWVAVWVVLVAHRIFVVLNWVGVGLRGFED